MSTATDQLFADALGVQSSLLAPSLIPDDDDESPEYVLGCMWDAFVSPDSSLLLPPPPPADEPAAFVFHINRDALDGDSCGGTSSDAPAHVDVSSCDSPTLITSTLALTPIKENRPKAKASRAGAATKPKRQKSEATGQKRAKVNAAGRVSPATAASAEAATAVSTEAIEDEGNSGASDGEMVSDDLETDLPIATSTAASPGDDNSKRVQRMMRNRASAAESRKRKRKQVEECEALVQSLKDAVKKLQEQNDELRRANALARTKQQELPAPPIETAVGA